MKRTLVIIIAAFAALFSSCTKEIIVDSGANFETKSFDDFLWKKHDPVSINATIDTKFDECEGISGPLVLRLCDDDARPIGTDIARLYVNGNESSDNTITIDPKNSSEGTDISIVLSEDVIRRDRTFTWNLQIVNNPGLVKVNERTPGSDPWIAGTTVNWNHNHVVNPLRVGVDTGLIILAIALALVIAVCQARIRRFKVTTIDIDDMADRKDSIMISSPRKYAKIVLTPTPGKKQNPIAPIFVGKVKYEYVEGAKWTSDVILVPKGRTVADAAVSAYSADSDYSFTEKGESIIMTHPNKAKSKITW